MESGQRPNLAQGRLVSAVDGKKKSPDDVRNSVCSVRVAPPKRCPETAADPAHPQRLPSASLHNTFSLTDPFTKSRIPNHRADGRHQTQTDLVKSEDRDQKSAEAEF